MAYAGKINYQVNLDVNQSNIDKIQQSLLKISTATTKSLTNGLSGKQAEKTLKQVQETASKVSKALSDSFNNALGKLNVSEFNRQLNNIGISKIQNDFMKLGTVGKTAFTQIATTALTTNLQLKQTTSFLDRMGQTLVNTVKWNIASKAINSFTGSIQSAFGYVKNLDTSLTNIRIVTGDSREEMAAFAKQANNAAQALGRSTLDYTKAALTFYQQGLGDQDVQARTQATLMAQNITRAGQEMADYLTAVWNGYKVANEEAELYVDKLAAVADSSASNMSQLAIAMSKVASTANMLGIDVDSLNAQIATIVATTRQAPESVGNALKTIYSRINDIATGADDAQISLGNYSKKMLQVGINVLDTNGRLRDTGDVIEEIGGKWASLSREQQIYLARTMAGQRQYNNLLALFENWGKYTDLVNVSMDSQGSLVEKNDRYMESLAAHLIQLKDAEEGVIQAFANGDSFKGVIDAGTKILNLFSKIITSIGGGGTALLQLGGIATQVFSKQIARELNNIIINFQNLRSNAQALAQDRENTKTWATSLGLNGQAQKGQQGYQPVNHLIQNKQMIQGFSGVLSNEQIVEATDVAKEIALLENQIEVWNENKKAAQAYAQEVLKMPVTFQRLKDDIDISKETQKFKTDIKNARDAYVSLYRISKDSSLGNIELRTGKSWVQYKQSVKQLVTQAKELAKTPGISENTRKSLEDYIQKVEQITNPGKSKDTKAAYAQLAQDLGSKVDKAAREASQSLQNFNNTVRDSEQIEQTTAKLSVLKNKLDDIKTGAQQLSTVQTFTNLFGIMTQFAGIISSSANLIKTFKDTSLSTGQKIQQVLMNLGSTGTMLFMMLPKLKTTIGGLAKVMGASTEVVGSLGKSFAYLASVAGPYILIAGAIAAAAVGIYLAITKESRAIKQQQKIIEQQKQRYENLRKEYDELQSSLENYKNARSALNELTQGTKQWNDKVKELNLQVNQLLEKYPELAKYVKRVNGQFVIDTQSQGYQGWLNNQQRKVETADRIVKQKQINLIQMQSSQKAGKLASDMTYWDTREDQLGWKELDPNIVLALASQLANRNFSDINNLNQKTFTQILKEIGYEDINNDLIKALIENKESIIELAKEVDENSATLQLYSTQMNSSQYENDERYNLLSAEGKAEFEQLYTNKVNTYMDSVRGGIQAYSPAKLHEQFAKLSSLTYAGRGEFKDEEGNIKKISQETEKELLIQRAAQDYVNTIVDTLYQQINTATEQVRQQRKAFSEADTIMGSAIESYSSKGKIDDKNLQEILNLITKLQNVKWDETIPVQDQQLFNNKLQEYYNILKDQALVGTQQYANALSGLNFLISKIDFSNLVADFQDLDIENTIKLTISQDNLDELNQFLNDLTSLNREITIQVHTDAEEEWESLTSTFDDVQKQAKKIGQNFIVAANDARALQNAFPGILKNAIVTADGQLQLNQQIATQAINSAKDVAVADSQAMQQRLNDQATLLEAKASSQRAAAKTAGEMAKQVLEGQQLTDSQRQKLAKELATIQSDLSQAASIDAQQAVSNTSDAEGEAAQTSSINWARSYQQQINSSIQAARIQIQNAAAKADAQRQAAAGEFVTAHAVTGSVGTGEFDIIKDTKQRWLQKNKSSRTKETVAAATIDLTQESADYYQKLSESLNAQAAADEAAARDIRAMIASLDAQTKGLQGGLSNIAAGKSYTPKKSSGSSGNKGSTAKPQTQKLSKDVRDVYHDVNRELQHQEDKLKDIQDQQKKLLDKDRLQNIQKQNDQLEKQKDLLSQKQGIAQGQLIRIRNELVIDTNGNVKFDGNQIANYNQMLADAEKVYNNYISYYNSLTKDQQETIKDQLEAEKEKYERIKKNAEEYEKTLDLLDDISDQQKQITDQIYQNRIALSKLNLQLAESVGDRQREWLDFEQQYIKKLSDEDIFGKSLASMKRISSYMDSEEIKRRAKELEDLQNEIALMTAGGVSSIYGDNLKAAQERLNELIKSQQDDLKQIQSLVDDIKDNYLDTIDKAQQKMDQQIDQYQRINDLWQHQNKMVELLYGDSAFDAYDKIANQQQQSAKLQEDMLRSEVLYWKEMMDKEVVDSDAWKKMRQNWEKAVDDLNSHLEDMIDNLHKKVEKNIDGIVFNLNLKLTNGKGLDFVSQDWDAISDYDDTFLDAFNREYGVQQIEDLYQSGLESLTGNLPAQARLNKLMNQQLSILQEKDKLTEYDIDRAKMLYQIEMKRFALEDAQANKTKMRLRRDSQGNYTYQYVADENAVAAAQKELADAQRELYNSDKQAYKKNLNQLYDVYENYMSQMTELTKQYNATQDEAERQRIQNRIDLLKSATKEIMQGLTDNEGYYLNYLGGSFFGENGLTDLTAEQLEAVKENVPYVDSEIKELKESIVGQGGILTATASAWKDITEAIKESDAAVRDILAIGGTSLEDIAGVVDENGAAFDENITHAQQLLQANQEIIDSCNAEIQAMQQLLSLLDQFIEKVVDATANIASLRDAYNLAQSLDNAGFTADNIPTASTAADSTLGNNYTGHVPEDTASLKAMINNILQQYEEFLSKMPIAKFDQGGYTGSWNDVDGRLAILHGQQLVLNKDDTANILSAVNVVRNLANSVGSILLGEMESKISSIGGVVNSVIPGNSLDQNVHIDASFPNVREHKEIEEAFNNLVNIASMKASSIFRK